MTLKADEGQRCLQAPRPSKNVARQTDAFEIAPTPLAINKLVRRFGMSAEVADLVAQLAGLGPRERA